MPRRLMIVAVTAAVTCSNAVAEDKSWVGEKVMVAKPGVQLVVRNGDSQTSFRLKGVLFPVLKEQDGWLRLRDRDGKEGWGEKTDFVLLQDAPAHYTDIIRQNENDIWAWGNRGLAWEQKGELDNAIKDFTEAIRLNPKYPIAFTSRAAVWKRKGDFDRAIADYDEAIRLDPRSVSAFNNRGTVWKAKKNYEKAIKDYDEAIRLDPADCASPLNNIAWIRASCVDPKYRDGVKAVELATRACELTNWKVPLFIDTLAAACAEAGDFTSAIKWAEKTLEDETYAKNGGETTRERLTLYRENKPYREQ